MTQVSRYMLQPEVWEKIFSLFTDTFLKIKDRKTFNEFIDGFFSPTEKIMFSKRLAIAVLLAKGNDYQTIKSTIRVTSGTISKINLLLKENKGLQTAVKNILKRDAGRVFWKEICDLMDYPHAGSDWINYKKRKSKREKKMVEIKEGLV